MIERLTMLFRDRNSPFSQRFRDELALVRDAVIENTSRLKIAENGVKSLVDRQATQIEISMFATISGVVSEAGLTYSGRKYWEYQWSEVAWTGAAISSPTGPRSSSSFTNALNIYELGMANDGANTTSASGATTSRLRIPNNAMIRVFVESDGFVWFDRANPLGVSCT